MILQRLYELAVREQMLDDPAFEEQPVKYSIQIGQGGQYLGIRELIGDGASKPGVKAPPNRGMPLPVPLAHGAATAAGFARFFCDILARVLPLTCDLADPEGLGSAPEREKRARSRSTFWKQIDEAARGTDDPALGGIQAFGRQLEDADLILKINADALAKNATGADRCTFAWHEDFGNTILEREPVKAFYRTYYEAWSGSKKEAGPVGVCQITGEVVPLPTTHPMKIQGVPGGLPTGVSLVSFDKDAFQSYGLAGAANAGIGYRAAEGYCRALIALIQEKLKGSPPTRLRVGETLFLIWTRDRDPISSDIVQSFADPNDERIARIKKKKDQERIEKEERAAISQAKELIEAADAGQSTRSGPEDPNRLYCLALSGNAARAIIRDYLEVPLVEAAANIARWFDDLSIVRVESKGAVSTTGAFPLWLLAAMTARKSEDVGPEVYPQLLSAALRGPEAPLPDKILVACLNRLRAEASQTLFKAPRMALIKLFLLRRNQKVSAALDESNRNPAYVCGRLLAIFEEIQFKAIPEVNTNVGDKYYGIFSSAPLMVFGRLYANSRKHLRKIRNEDFKAFSALTRSLAEVSSLIRVHPAKELSPFEEERLALFPEIEFLLPEGTLSPLEQGTFALGYYHQLNAKFLAINEAKARKTANAAESETPDES